MKGYILSGKRTPSGSFLGGLSKVSAPHLGAAAIKSAIDSTGITFDSIDEVFMGEVIQAGVGQAPARQAALFAGIPNTVPCTTVNKVCGSGLKTIILGSQSIQTHDNDLVIAGGMENMSLAPHLIQNSRAGMKYGASEIKDSMQWDGLWDVYSDRPMGNCAEECVQKYKISRQEMDDYAIESFKRAQEAIEKGVFNAEIAPVEIKSKRGSIIVDKDEGPFKAKFEKIPTLKPVFDNQGSITAANASTINDGAAAVVLAGEKYKNKAKFKIIGYASSAGNPTWFTTAPIHAMKSCFAKTKFEAQDIDLYEVNEAFAVVPLVCMKEFEIPHSKINIYGGGVSLGHPIGCSGARIVVTLMNALEKEDKEIGMASICIGGGEALAIIIQKI